VAFRIQHMHDFIGVYVNLEQKFLQPLIAPLIVPQLSHKCRDWFLDRLICQVSTTTQENSAGSEPPRRSERDRKIHTIGSEISRILHIRSCFRTVWSNGVETQSLSGFEASKPAEVFCKTKEFRHMLERRYLSIDGLRWSFLEKGKATPEQPTLVLLHGLMGCAQTFAPLMESLGTNLHIVALDLPGAGESERRDDLDPRLLATAEQVARVLQVLGIKRPVVLGHSHGGAVALSLSARYRDSLRSLVLLAPAHPYFDEGDPLIRFYLSIPGRLIAYSLPWYPEWLQMMGLRRMAGKASWDTPEQLRPYRQNLRTPGTIHHLLRLLKSWKKDFSGLHKALRKPVATPILIVWGDHDRAVPVQSAPKLQERLLRSELVVLRGIGHRPAEEAAAAVAHLVHEWLERDTAAESVHYSPKLSASQRRSAALIPSSLEAGD